MSRSEWLRKAVHIAAFLPAFLLPWLTPGQALLLAAGAFAMNSTVLLRVLPGLYRKDVPGRGVLEIILYPTALLALLAAYAYPALPPGAAPWALAGQDGKPAWYLVPLLAWFGLGLVDAAIGIGCRMVNHGPTLPWNPRKTWAGVLLGLAVSSLLLGLLGLKLSILPGIWPDVAWYRSLDPSVLSHSPAGIGILPALAGLLLLAVLAESAWFGIADNLVVPFALCVLAPLVSTPFFPDGGLGGMSWPVLLLPVAFGGLSFAFGMLTAGGALLGAAMSFVVMMADPWLFAWLGGFFVLAVGATRFRFDGKAARKVAEARGGRRSAAQVFGAMGAAAWMTPLVHLAKLAAGEAGLAGAAGAVGAAGVEGIRGALLVCAAPFVAKTMDTVSSEIGKAVGGPTISLRYFRKVPPGTEGGVSAAGTLWGLAAAGILSLLAIPLGWGGLADVGFLLLIALAANILESLWGEWAARRGLEDGPQTNFIMTLFAALMAWCHWIRF